MFLKKIYKETLVSPKLLCLKHRFIKAIWRSLVRETLKYVPIACMIICSVSNGQQKLQEFYKKEEKKPANPHFFPALVPFL